MTNLLTFIYCALWWSTLLSVLTYIILQAELLLFRDNMLDLEHESKQWLASKVFNISVCFLTVQSLLLFVLNHI